jgi:RHS repeat-associated protein
VEYDSFGAREITVGTAAEMPRYGFTGREHDAESGLIYYRARHYDPAIGQFLQRDPIGFAAGDLNLYAYVGNDPYNFTDPSGLSAVAGDYANSGTGTAATGVSIAGTIQNGLISFIVSVASDPLFAP